MTLRSAIEELIPRGERRDAAPQRRDPEFDYATRKSQLIRLRIMLALAPMFMVIVVTRFIFTREVPGFVEIFSMLCIIAFYEGCVYAAARRADRQDRSLPLWFWQLNAVVESLFPTIAIALVSSAGIVPPYRSLVSPLTMGYPLFMILSILSLRPSLALISGVVSALGYLGLLFFGRANFDAPPNDPLPMSIMVLLAPYLFLLGVAAAWVAARIRAHALAEIHETARRETMEHDLYLAGRIQGGLLPASPPDIRGFEVAGWNRPAIHAGGDYYDWIALPGRRVAVVLADVTGHGLGPAVLAVLCRSYLRAALTQHESLQEAMGVVNRLVQDDLPDGWFITMAVALLREGEDEVELFSAGHGPMLRVGADGAVEQLRADAPPLGIDASFSTTPSQRVQLAAGESLALLTDGFHEWGSPSGEIFGLERLRHSLGSRHEQSPHHVIVGILADVEGFANGAPQCDDLTALVVKCSPSVFAPLP